MGSGHPNPNATALDLPSQKEELSLEGEAIPGIMILVTHSANVKDYVYLHSMSVLVILSVYLPLPNDCKHSH